ncbi:hypothetical protein Poli38472_008402 [Pythium oligandrum]|uniref:Ubiquitin-like 1-activating enzyme E1A n=1 Tax=Pythium oligandrum TaxID=41045 RepID=A0A8K1FJ70_PYTOL|nr:hypothetical protein Poli38472_008402 [Pythium oligandrum]|eukprot:TMW65760.1 hypothetical protein Poli38472_008402 [Pythium oligandrum]
MTEMETYFRRQMTAIGATAMEQIGLMHVLVVGLRGVGVEMAKCLVMSGVQRLTLMDDELVREEDVGVNFLLREGDVGKPKSRLMATRLKELSPFTDIRTLPGALTLDLLLNFHVVVFTSSNVSMAELIAYNEFCRAQSPPIGFVWAESRGLFGTVFVDYGAVHKSIDASPLNQVEFRVLTKRTQIVGDTVTLVVREQRLRGHLQPGDLVQLRESPEALGDNSLVFTVHEVVSDSKLVVRCEFTEELETQRDEITCANRLRKVPDRIVTTNHRSLRERMVDAGPIACPLATETISDRGRNIHMALLGVHSFRREFGFLPSKNNIDHIQQALQLVHDTMEMNAQVVLSAQHTATSSRIDEKLVGQLLRCSSSDFLPLSAVIAGYAAIDVLGFSGAMGQRSYANCQFLAFDLLPFAPTVEEIKLDKPAGLHSAQPSALAAIFGSSALQRLRKASPLFIGFGPVCCETVKNSLCLGIGVEAPSISVALTQEDQLVVGREELNAHALFNISSIGTSKRLYLENLRQSIRVIPDLSSVGFDDLASASSVYLEADGLFHRFFVDDQCCAHEKPVVISFIDRSDGFRHVRSVFPHRTATTRERYIPPAMLDNAQIHAFDHVPTHLEVRDDENLLEVEECAQRAVKTFELVFSTAIQNAVECFATKQPLKEKYAGQDSVVWMLWHVIRRGYQAQTFEESLRAAWILLELLPNIMTASTAESNPSDANASPPLVQVDIQIPDQLQLLVSTACIIANSLGLPIPPLPERRAIVVDVAASADAFSLHSNPRTIASILASLESADSTHMQQIVTRAKPTPLNLDDVDQMHLHFVQSLLNLQLARRNAPRVTTFAQLRRILRQPADFPPIVTILGGVATLELIKSLLQTPRSLENLREYMIQPHQSTLCVAPPPMPLAVHSLPLEATRGVALRTIPEQFTRWSKLIIPTTPELQSTSAIVQYLQKKHDVVVHELRFQGRRIAISKDSVFTFCSSSSSTSTSSMRFIFLSVVAIDARGDVIFPPIRITRTEA